MGIEERLETLNEAIVALTALLKRQAPVASDEKAPAEKAPAKKTTAKKTPAKKEPEAVTIDQLRKLGGAVGKDASEGREKVVAALQRLGAERLNELAEDHYAEFYSMLERIRDDEEYDPRDSSGTDKEEEEDEDF